MNLSGHEDRRPLQRYLKRSKSAISQLVGQGSMQTSTVVPRAAATSRGQRSRVGATSRCRTGSDSAGRGPDYC